MNAPKGPYLAYHTKNTMVVAAVVIYLVDVSDFFPARGRGRGSSKGGGVRFLLKIPGGVFPGPREGGRGAGRVSAENLAGGGGLIFFFSGPKFPPSLLLLQVLTFHRYVLPCFLGKKKQRFSGLAVAVPRDDRDSFDGFGGFGGCGGFGRDGYPP